MIRNSVTLQISLSPNDYRHAKHLLHNQLDVLSNHVNEVLLTVDTRKSAGRFGLNWDENQTSLTILLKSIQDKYPSVVIKNVEYHNDVEAAISNFFFGKTTIPTKDFRGGPFYSYFYGLYYATSQYVLHIDSDMFLGGNSQTWISEALTLFHENKTLFTVSPLPGPPHPQQQLISQNIIKQLNAPYAFELSGFSTRVFMIDKSIFLKEKLQLSKPSFKNQLKALLEGNSNADLPEHLFSNFIKAHALKRVDFLGNQPGLWTLHPPYRTEAFYENLPTLIQRVEINELPDKQKGFYDIIDEVCDWTEARDKIIKNKWWRRFLSKKFGLK
ncbi:MAG TPA: hypothetical protein VGB63_03950 [Pedobacter sp.]|jgi:hypothetical protein